MKLRAISDLHLASPANRDALVALPDYSDDWLILAGDVVRAVGLTTAHHLNGRQGRVVRWDVSPG